MSIQASHFVSVATLLLLSLAASALAAGRHLLDSNGNVISGITIPAAIAVPSGNKLRLAVLGVGFQHYTFNGTQWVLQNATANLYTLKNNTLFGIHFYLEQKDAKGGQPSWESFHPESLVTAKGIASVTVDPSSITWNLLQETSESGSKKVLGDVTYVQRLETQLGLPPSLNASSVQNGDTYLSPYSAIYAFYVEK